MADEVLIFSYRDAAGREVFTNEPASVPRELQGTLVEVDMGPHVVMTPKVTEELGGVHLASAALGAAAMAVALLLPRVLRRGRWIPRTVGVVAAVAVLGGLYFGWVMRTAGLGTGAFADPRAAIDAAHRAVEDTKKAADARERAVEKTE